MSDNVGNEAGSPDHLVWLQELASYSGPDTLLEFTKAPEGSIDLSHAHPSGLAQLLAGRRTRLSTLIREPGEYTVALRTARTLRGKIFELGSERGIDVGYLAAGTATWINHGAAPHRVCAPVLLTAIVLTVRPGQDDFELQLTEQARVNPALLRHLDAVHGITFDAVAMARLAYSTARFDPAPVLERLRTVLQPIKGVSVEHHLLVSTFADLSENLNDPALRQGSPLISSLAVAASGEGQAPQEIDADRFPSLDSRAPQDEVLVLDADPQQQCVLDAIRAGESLVVSAPPGTGQTQTAINAIAALVSEGRTVLVVGERRATLNELAQRFDGLGLDSLLLQLNAQTGPQQLKTQLVRAIVRNEQATAPKLANLHRTLVDYRHQLLDHVASLHNVRDRWGCSPYQAMQSLAELTSIHPAPSTTVRLKRSVLDTIKDRKELGERLRRAAELGSFSAAATTSPWYGARLVTRKETEEAHALAVGLSAELPAFGARMDEVSDFSEIRHGKSFAEWGEQLDLLVAVRESLDKFTPDIFDRPVTDLISATASSGWRRERGVEMAAMQRSRLRRLAKEYVRPGVHITDLHESLLLVQEQRAQWADLSVSQRHPAVPSGLADLRAQYLALSKDLHRLGAALEKTAGGGALDAMDYGELKSRLNSLAADKATLESLPERTLLLENMREQGLGELLDDLAEREVAPERTRAELDLAWWQSALEAMISGDDYLAMSDGASLRQLEAEFRLADQAHVASGSARLRWRLAERWQKHVDGRNRQAEQLRTLLKDGRVTLESIAQQAPDLISSLVPVWTASPLVLPGLLPSAQRFDAVVVLDAESTPLQAALPALARGSQIVVFGDEKIAAPRPFSVAVEQASAEEALNSSLDSVATALSRVLPKRRLTVSYRAVDEDLVLQLSNSFYDGQLQRIPDGPSVTGLERSLLVDYLPDGTGLPGSGTDGVESVVAEVNRVVDLVFEHARVRPHASLAVITASERHAARVAQAIRMQMPNHPLLAEFFGAGPESFRVVTVDRAAGLVRDHIVFSLGYGRTPHGRALHNFGPLSASDGREKFALAMTRARKQLQIVTCFRPEDLDPDRLNNGARDFYELIDRELAGHSLLGTTASRAAASEAAMGEDPLVSDLAERLRARGARVWHHYDGVLDMVAAVDPMHTLGQDDDEIPTPVAVESDGTAKYGAMSVRERSRLRPQLLEQLGWRYMSLWTIEVFTDPSACADQIGGYLGLTSDLTEGETASLMGSRNQPAQPAGHRAPMTQVPRTHLQEDQDLDGTNAAAEDGASTDLVPEDRGDGASKDPASKDPASEDSEDGAAEDRGTDALADQEVAEGHPSTENAARLGNAEPPLEASSGNASPSDPAFPTEDSHNMPTVETPEHKGADTADHPAGDDATHTDPLADEPVLPLKAAEDDPRRWGDTRTDSYDEWLKEQRPPHWD